MRKNTNNRLIVTKIIGEAFFIYGLLGWIYGVLLQLIHPCLIESPLSHLTPWLRLDIFTILSFIISMAGFFILRLYNQKIHRSIKTAKRAEDES